jgi:hypothetical protein
VAIPADASPQFGDARHVSNELSLFTVACLVVGGSQNGRGMYGSDYMRCKRGCYKLAAVLRDSEARPKSAWAPVALRSRLVD